MDRERERRCMPMTCKDVNKLDFAQPNLKGHVTVAKPNEKFDSMDMKVHLILKSNEKSKNRVRSHSLSRREGSRKDSVLFIENNCTKANTEKFTANNESRGKRWSDILLQNEVPPHRSSKNTHASNRNRRSRSVSPESEVHEEYFKNKQGKYKAATNNCQPMEDLNAFALFNPVRTLRFLICELRNMLKPQGERQEAIYAMIEQVLAKIPQNSPQSTEKSSKVKQGEHDPATPKPANQFSRTGFENMRKERDTIQRQLNEKSKSHIALERKVATLEAKLVRLRSERDELRGVNEKLIAEQKSLISTLNAKGKDNPEQQTISRLVEELNSAHEHISKLQRDILFVEKQYNSKMTEVQHILHDGFEVSKNDSLHLGDILGQPPEEEPSLLDPGHFSIPNIENPEVRPVTPEPPTSPPPTERGKINIEQYITNLMQQTRFLRDEQLNIFQSFISEPDISPN